MWPPPSIIDTNEGFPTFIGQMTRAMKRKKQRNRTTLTSIYRLLEQKESKPRDLPQSPNGIRGNLYGHGQRITSTSANFKGHVLVIIGRGVN